MFKKTLKKLVLSFVIACSFACLSFSSTLETSSSEIVIPEDQKATLTDLTIVVSSCGKYSDCWEPFCKLLFKYWPSLKTYNKHIKIIFITTEKDFSFDGVDVLKIPQDISWSDNLIEALKLVKTKYVLYMQEDYMLMQPVNERRMDELLKGMAQSNAVYLQLTDDGHAAKTGSPYPAIPGTAIKGKYQDWRPSLRSALGETKLFLWLLKPGENPWQFESADGSYRSQGVREPFLACAKDDPIPVYNACNIGYWTQGGLDFLKKEGLPVNNPTLPVFEDYPFTHWLKAHYPSVYRKWLSVLEIFDPKFQKNPVSRGQIKYTQLKSDLQSQKNT